jgi:hypothetical protein
MIYFKLLFNQLVVVLRLSNNALAKADLLNHHHGSGHDRCSSKSTNTIRSTGLFLVFLIFFLILFMSSYPTATSCGQCTCGAKQRGLSLLRSRRVWRIIRGIFFRGSKCRNTVWRAASSLWRACSATGRLWGCCCSTTTKWEWKQWILLLLLPSPSEYKISDYIYGKLIVGYFKESKSDFHPQKEAYTATDSYGIDPLGIVAVLAIAGLVIAGLALLFPGWAYVKSDEHVYYRSNDGKF